MCLSWVAGLIVWGAPESGFGTASPIFWWATLLIIGAPILLAGSVGTGLATEARPWVRGLFVTLWVVGLLAVAYLTQFVHFGGFCLDETDVCGISWPARIASLLLALFIVAVSAASEQTARWWRLRHKAPTTSL